MPGFQVPGDLALNARGTDVLLKTGIDLVSQLIQVGALVFRGTWRADRKRGIPYLTQVLGKRRDFAVVRSVFQRFLQGVPGVASVEVVTLNFDRPSRIMRVGFTVRTDTGELLQDEIFYELAD